MTDPTPADNPWTVDEDGLLWREGQMFGRLFSLGVKAQVAVALNDAARLEARAVAAETALAAAREALLTLKDREWARLDEDTRVFIENVLLDVPDQPTPTGDEPIEDYCHEEVPPDMVLNMEGVTCGLDLPCPVHDEPAAGGSDA